MFKDIFKYMEGYTIKFSYVYIILVKVCLNTDYIIFKIESF